jgi:fucose 4-O-acetylase-like acetyltransferase
MLAHQSHPAARSKESRLKRNASADSLRGLAIVLVVLGHSMVSVAWVYHAGPGLTMLSDGHWVSDSIALNPILNVIYAFHMPLFAFVSGLVSWRPRLSPAVGQLKSRFLGLVIPYFAWVVVYYFLTVRPPALEGLGLGLRAAAMNPWGGLWYLYALFECYVLLILIQRLPYSKWILAATALGAIALSATRIGGSHTFGVGDVIYIYPFFVGGYLASEKADAIRSRRYLVAGISLAAFAVLLAARGPIWRPDMSWVLQASKDAAGFMHRTWHIRHSGLATSLAGPVFVRYASSMTAIVALTALYSGWTGRLMDWQAWLGRRTLGVYAIHQILQVGLFALGVTNWVAMFALSLSISIGLTLVLERIPVVRGLLLGQWKRPASTRGPDGPEDEFAAEGDPSPGPDSENDSSSGPIDEVLGRDLPDLERNAEREVLVADVTRHRAHTNGDQCPDLG